MQNLFRSTAWNLYGCLILMALGSLGGRANAASKPEIFVPYTDTASHPIQIDGQAADWPERARAYGIHFYASDGHAGSASAYGTTVLGTMSNQQDGDVTVYLTHDGNSLYLLAVIQDDQLEQRTAENNANEAWKEDCLHIYIDSNNAGKSAIASPPISNQAGYEQFGVSTDLNCYTENCDFTTHNGGGAALAGAQPDQQHWKVAVGITGGGPYTYTFEEKIPLKEVSGHNLRTMQPGQSYGFNAEFCDSDAGAYLQGWIFWSADGANDPWNSEDKWGVMRLEEIINKIATKSWVNY